MFLHHGLTSHGLRRGLLWLTQYLQSEAVPHDLSPRWAAGPLLGRGHEVVPGTTGTGREMRQFHDGDWRCQLDISWDLMVFFWVF